MEPDTPREGCAAVADRLRPMLEDGLDERERAAVEAHVEGCEACQSDLARLADGSAGSGEDTAFLDRLKRVAPASTYRAGGREPAHAASGLPPIAGFHIIREVGRGGMGTVFEAIELALGRRVALKVVRRDDIGNPNAAERFRREARSAAGLHHTNIVPVFGVGEDAGYLYYAMQFIDGEGLDRVIDRLRHEGRGAEPTAAGPPPSLDDFGTPRGEAPTVSAASSLAPGADATTVAGPPTGPGAAARPRPPSPPASSPGSSAEGRSRHRGVARVGLQIAEALEFAHRQGILHRDVKPSNVLIDTAGAAWVADFGLAKTLDGEGDGLTRTGDIVGTLRYMAPERFDGLSDVRGDVYALGVTLYELLTLRPIFEESNRARLIERVLREEPPRPRGFDRRLPRDLETIVLKAMAKEPAARYATAGAMAADLRLYLAGEPILARRSGPAERTWRWARRNPAVAGLAGAVVLASALGFSLTLWQAARAVRAEADMSRERDRAVSARGDARRLAAGLLVDRGLGLLDRGDSQAGRLWLARSLQAPELAPEARRVAGLNLAAWGEAAPRLARIFAAPEGISTFAFSPDGATLHAYGVADRTLRHFDTATGAQRGSAPVVAALPIELRFDYPGFLDNGRTLYIISGHRRSLEVFDVETGARRGEAIPLVRGTDHLRFDPEGVAAAIISPAVVTAAILNPYWLPNLFDTVEVLGLGTGRRLGPDLPIAGPYALSPGGRTLLTLGPGGGRFLDVATGRLVATAPEMPARVRHLSFDPRGGLYTLEDRPSTAAGSSPPHVLRFWDAAGSPRGEVRDLSLLGDYSFGPDGETLAIGSSNGIVELFDARRATRRAPEPYDGSFINTNAFSPDGSTVAIGTFDGKVRLRDTLTGRPRGAELMQAASIDELCFTPDGTGLAVLTAGAVRLWRLPSRPVPADRPSGTAVATRQGGQATFAPGAGSALVVTPREADARVARPDGPPTGAATRLGLPSLIRLAASPDRRRWATTSHDGNSLASTLRLLDADGTPVGDPLPHQNWIIDLAFSPDGKTLAATGYAGALWLYDAADGRPLRLPLAVQRAAMSLAFAPDGRSLVVGTGPSIPLGKSIQLQRWDLSTGRLIGSADLDEWAMFVAFSPDGRSLLVRSGHALDRSTYGRYQIWDAATLKPRGEPLVYPVPTPRAVAFLPGGRLLTGGPGGIWQWEVAAGRPRNLVIPLHRALLGVAVDPSARWVATLGEDGLGQLHEGTDYRPIGPSLRAERPILALAFAADGRSVVGALDDATLRRWPLPSAAEVDDDSVAVAVATGAGLDPLTGAVQILSATRWLRLAQGHPTAGAPPADDPASRHAAGAAAAESEGNAFAALWNLDRLAPLRPGDWTIPARRAEVLAADGRLAEAARAMALASKLAPAGAIRGWEMGRAVDARDASRPELALWHLDRTIQGSPDDLSALQMRSEIYAAQGRSALRDADLDRAASLGMDPVAASLYAERRAREGRWDRALAALVASESRRADPSGRLTGRRAIASLHAGDAAGYRDACARMLDLARRLDAAVSPNNAAYLCALGPGALDDYAVPIAMVRRELERTPADRGPVRHVYLNTLGAVLYRAGDFRGAVARLEEGMAANGGRGVAEDWAFLALAYHALDDDRSARDRLGRLGPEVRPDFWDEAEFALLVREARAALLTDGPARPPR